ncbi:pyridoxine 5'-phosphate synthase [Gammaproteobacteria bacterium]|nr:pyridoxine 5'-phosphate synthase [Gammaproteobacteria bacterium]
MNFSLNLNKIALLRNARGENYPKLEEYAYRAIDLGVDGLTLHPRPDQRHATCEDVVSISSICKDRKVEFNIEGNPFSEASGEYSAFMDLVRKSVPEQVTLVPDSLDQVTSDHGWVLGFNERELATSIQHIRSFDFNSRVSLFVDSTSNNVINYEILDYCLKVGADTIEVHTGPFSKLIAAKDFTIIDSLKLFLERAKDKGLNINAGHDLNLSNLKYLKDLDLIDEVSIGHAIIVDALNFGFDDTIKKYIDIIKG